MTIEKFCEGCHWYVSHPDSHLAVNPDPPMGARKSVVCYSPGWSFSYCLKIVDMPPLKVLMLKKKLENANL